MVYFHVYIHPARKAPSGFLAKTDTNGGKETPRGQHRRAHRAGLRHHNFSNYYIDTQLNK